MHIDAHNGTIVLKTNELGGRGHHRRVGEKEEQRDRGQLLQQRFSVWFLKLPQKILKSLCGPTQDRELAGRMAHFAARLQSISGAGPPVMNNVFFCRGNTKEFFLFTPSTCITAVFLWQTPRDIKCNALLPIFLPKRSTLFTKAE